MVFLPHQGAGVFDAALHDAVVRNSADFPDEDFGGGVEPEFADRLFQALLELLMQVVELIADAHPDVAVPEGGEVLDRLLRSGGEVAADAEIMLFVDRHEREFRVLGEEGADGFAEVAGMECAGGEIVLEQGRQGFSGAADEFELVAQVVAFAPVDEFGDIAGLFVGDDHPCIDGGFFAQHPGDGTGLVVHLSRQFADLFAGVDADPSGSGKRGGNRAGRNSGGFGDVFQLDHASLREIKLQNNEITLFHCKFYHIRPAKSIGEAYFPVKNFPQSFANPEERR